MIVDTSAVVAILRAEPNSAALEHALAQVGGHLMSAATRVELSLVLAATHTEQEVDEVLVGWGVSVVPFTAEQAKVAAEGHRVFGKGNHPAKLNLGDTYSYALARATGRPLLCTGNDFALTDLALALPEP